jgi:hypothetical protein
MHKIMHNGRVFLRAVRVRRHGRKERERESEKEIKHFSPLTRL